MKKHTSKEIVKAIGEINESRSAWLLRGFSKAAQEIKQVKKYKIWQDGNHSLLLDTNKMMEERFHYLHHNPVEAELVDEPECYWYSSARVYAGQKVLMEVSLL